MPGDEKSDAVIEHRTGTGEVVSRDVATLTFGGMAKAAGAIAVTLITGALITGFAFYVSSTRDGAVDRERQERADAELAKLSTAMSENSKALSELTKAIERLPTRTDLESRSQRATDEAVQQSKAYTDQQVATARQEAAQMSRDIAWIREKQEEQSRELRDGFKAIEKRLNELPRP